MPPFAQIKEAIYIIDKKISENSKVIVNSGSNTESIILSPTVLKKLLKKIKQTMNRI
jgi:prolyl-tRNA editing enzyme YbaK/EbsC (Cys-tRNA(Pro) deacylase)